MCCRSCNSRRIASSLDYRTYSRRSLKLCEKHAVSQHSASTECNIARLVLTLLPDGEKVRRMSRPKETRRKDGERQV